MKAVLLTQVRKISVSRSNFVKSKNCFKTIFKLIIIFFLHSQLKQLVDRGHLSRCSDEIADLAEDLGCTVDRPSLYGNDLLENRAVITVPEIPDVKALVTSAFVMAYCLK